MSIFNKVHDRRGSASVKWDMMNVVYNLKDNTTELLPMWVADMDFPPPAALTEALKARLEHPIFGYTFADNDVKNAIVHWYKTRHQWTIDPNTIIFQPGVVPAIATIIETFTEVGDKIGMSTPAYPPFTNVPAAQKREVVTCELTEQNGHYTMDFAELEEIFRAGIKLFVLCNPHNPIGIVWSREELEQLVALCVQYDVYLLSDEIHADISIQKSYTPVLTLANANEAKIITCIAPTKTFNIAGIHAAMIVASDRKLFTAIEKNTQAHGNLGLNTFASTAVKAVYSEGAAWLDDLLVYIKNNMEYVAKELNAIEGLDVEIPDATYLMWIDYRKTGIEEKELMARLLSVGLVALDPGTKYGEAGRGFLRINVACPFELLQDGVERIKRTMATFE
ncbi:biproductal PLP-dependent enzyme with beta-cystathionase and maltose regulon repressor activities [Solibacillus silvestris StLB046]|uniref:cysteine-S-conjugate beta-lyase n=2 Tax=Bacteria TaxID=2 RepID=F2F7M9_SOLSS|nr:MalY/PatB family protein [Solibacillus silvestris]BAK15504.1 biproductal PLP-dependent enzyme with beta-cystathionase and maltose regulon repressor activities [Solibacillus silvestris StLB046]